MVEPVKSERCLPWRGSRTVRSPRRGVPLLRDLSPIPHDDTVLFEEMAT